MTKIILKDPDCKADALYDAFFERKCKSQDLIIDEIKRLVGDDAAEVARVRSFFSTN